MDNGRAAIRRENTSIFNRLHSIASDAAFVASIAQDIFPSFPLVPNERCGSWYIPPNKCHGSVSVYFKSTDGHYGNWGLNTKRLNLHVLPLIIQHQGIIIVDSTRKGKKMPDSLSKTIPIWCAVMNRLALQFNSERAANWDTDLHTPPSMVSPSEHSQITEKLVEFVGQVLELQTDWAKVLRNLNKPLRPLWVTPDSILVEQDWSELDFIPIVCLTASESVQNGMDSRVGYVYVPGSADDHELWSQGLDHHLFWKHSEELLNCKDSAACEEAVLWIVSDTRNQLDSTAKSLSSSAPFHFLGNTGLAIGNRKSSQPPDCWNNFDAIINCGAPEFNGICDANPDSYLYLAIPEGKRGQNELFRSIPTALNFALKFLKDNNRILIHCMQGKDRSVGITLAILLKFFDKEGRFVSEGPNREISKTTVTEKLLFTQSFRPEARPSRATLKKINLYYMGY